MVGENAYQTDFPNPKTQLVMSLVALQLLPVTAVETTMGRAPAQVSLTGAGQGLVGVHVEPAGPHEPPQAACVEMMQHGLQQAPTGGQVLGTHTPPAE